MAHALSVAPCTAPGQPGAVDALEDETAPMRFVLQYIDGGFLVYEWANPIILATHAKAEFLRSQPFVEYVAILPVYRHGYARMAARIGAHWVGFNHLDGGNLHHGERFEKAFRKGADA